MAAPISKLDLYNKIDSIIKRSPAATDTTKLQGYLHKELLEAIVDAIFQQTQATVKVAFPWRVPFTHPLFFGQSIDSDDLADGLYKLLHPAQPPKANLSAAEQFREVGSNPEVVLTYSFNQGTYPLETVFVNGTQVSGLVTSGTQVATTLPDTDTTFQMTVTDVNGTAVAASARVRYLSRFFIFTSAQKLAKLSDNEISILLHQSNGLLADSKVQNATINPNKEYYYIAYSNTLGINPFIKANGIQDTSAKPHQFTYLNSQGVNQDFTIYCGENVLTGIYNMEVS